MSVNNTVFSETTPTSTAQSTYFAAQNQRRSHLEIKIAALQSISNNEPMISSRIRYDAMLSWKVFHRELHILQKQGLITTTPLQPVEQNALSSQRRLFVKPSEDTIRAQKETNCKSRGREGFILTESGKTVLEIFTKLQKEFRNIESLEEPMQIAPNSRGILNS